MCCQEENYLLLIKYVLTCVCWCHPCLSFAHVVNTQFSQSVYLSIYVRTWGWWWSCPTRTKGEQPGTNRERKMLNLCFALLFYTMARDMLSLDAYSLPDEWQEIKSCTKNRQDGAYKIGTPIVCQNTLPPKQEHNMNITSHTYIYNKSCVNILTLNLSNLWQTFFDCALFVPHSHSIIQPSRTQSDLTATSS